VILQQEKLEKYNLKQKRKREAQERQTRRMLAREEVSDSEDIDSHDEDEGGEDEEDNIEDPYRFRNEVVEQVIEEVKKPPKQSFRTKDIRIIDEESLRNIDVEFIIKQETHMQDCLKDLVMETEFIRTADRVKVLTLKKLIL
jgi:hypothetical protein